MKATGRLITGSIGARARMVGSGTARAWTVPQGVTASARQTDGVNLYKYLRVTPTEPQQLVWLIPQYGIDYTIESNTDWNIK